MAITLILLIVVVVECYVLLAGMHAKIMPSAAPPTYRLDEVDPRIAPLTAYYLQHFDMDSEEFEAAVDGELALYGLSATAPGTCDTMRVEPHDSPNF
jgi:hypothetical protein